MLLNIDEILFLRKYIINNNILELIYLVNII